MLTLVRSKGLLYLSTPAEKVVLGISAVLYVPRNQSRSLLYLLAVLSWSQVFRELVCVRCLLSALESHDLPPCSKLIFSCMQCF